MSDLAFDFREFYRTSRAARAERLADVFDRPVLSLGPQLEEFERRCLPYTGFKADAAVSNCTTGLMLSLSHFAKGRRVLLPSLSFGATVVSALWAECDLVFGHYDPATLNLCPDDAQARLKRGQVDALVFVAVGGSLAGLDPIAEVAAEWEVPLVVDAAGAFGAKVPAKGIAAMVFSFASRKPLPISEGGLLCSDDAAFIRQMRRSRVYGTTDGYECATVGLNARMSEAHAAMGCAQLAAFEETTQRRLSAARAIKRLTPGVAWQDVGAPERTSYADLVGLVDPDRRDGVLSALREIGIDTFPFYDPPVPFHAAFRAHPAIQCDAEVGAQLNRDFVGRPVGFRPVSTFSEAHVQTISDKINDVLRQDT